MSNSPARSKFHSTFYVANTMEIFERLAWYGFFALSSLYMSSPIAQGGLGFSDQERGFLQGMIPFLLYLLPVLTGALADRYGYRRMFLLAFLIMCPSYFLLGQMHSFWPFCAVFLAVALGAACFKPVVVGTIGRTTDDSNRGLGFGVFYTMVNVGGFLGPLVAGYVRAISWDMVFIMSSFWILLNFIPALFFYKEPQSTEQDQRSLRQVLLEAQEVLGNGRLALLVLPAIIGLMVAAKGGISYAQFGVALALWLALNLLWSATLKKQTSTQWYRQTMRVGNTNFVLYLLIMAGFWTIYNQVFLTLPLYIRDFVDTHDLVDLVSRHAPQLLDFLAGVNQEQLAAAIPSLAAQLPASGDASVATLQTLHSTLVNFKVMPPVAEIQHGLHAFQQGQLSASQLANAWATNYRQINPEYIINLDFAAIVLLQMGVSMYIGRWQVLPILVVGTLVLAGSFVLCGLAGGAIAVMLAVVVFALGEMIASPKSQEYVAAIAPPRKTAMFMGYYFVAMALGNLFAGLLSGWAYQHLAKDLQKPMLMWGLFAGIGVLTALALLALNLRLRSASQREQARLASAY